MTTFYCLRFETPPTWTTRSLYLYPPGTGWPSYTPRHLVSFSSPPTTRRDMVEVFEPDSKRFLLNLIPFKVTPRARITSKHLSCIVARVVVSAVTYLLSRYLESGVCFFFRIFHGNGYTCYNIFRDLGWRMNDELKGIRKDAVQAYSR
jgi:hypothetical protein